MTAGLPSWRFPCQGLQVLGCWFVSSQRRKSSGPKGSRICFRRYLGVREPFGLLNNKIIIIINDESTGLPSFCYFVMSKFLKSTIFNFKNFNATYTTFHLPAPSLINFPINENPDASLCPPPPKARAILDTSTFLNLVNQSRNRCT